MKLYKLLIYSLLICSALVGCKGGENREISLLESSYKKWRQDWLAYREKKAVSFNGLKVKLGYNLADYEAVLPLPGARELVSIEVAETVWNEFIKAKLEQTNSSSSLYIEGDEFLAFVVCARKKWKPEDILRKHARQSIGGVEGFIDYLKLPSLVISKLATD